MCRDVLDLTLPVIEDDDLETLINQRAMSVVRALESPPAGYAGNSSNGQNRVQVVLQFCETKRKKTYFFGNAEDQICWEQWILDVACARPKSDIGEFLASDGHFCSSLTGSREPEGPLSHGNKPTKSCNENCHHCES